MFLRLIISVLLANTIIVTANSTEPKQNKPSIRTTVSEKNKSVEADSMKSLLKLYLDSKRYAEALEVVDKALLNRTNDAELSYLVAKTFYLSNQLENAEFFAKRAVEFNPYYECSYLVLGDVYVSLSTKDEHLSEQEFLLSEAYVNYHKAQKLNGDLPDYMIGYAYIEKVKGHDDKALDYLIAAKDINKYYPKTILELACLYRSTKRYEQSLKYYNEYLKLEDYVAEEVYMDLAKIYEKLGDLSLARQYYLFVYNHNSNNMEARIRLKSLEKL